jgi:peroxiredoxin
LKVNAGWTKCSICGARLKVDKLEGHLKAVHPKGVKTREERAQIVSRRKTASGATKWIALTAIIVVIILVSYYAISHLDIRGSNVGNKPYNFTLTATDGNKDTLDDHLGSKPVFLGFLSTECIHCQRMSPIIQRLYVNYSDKVDFIVVISYGASSMSDVQTFANDYGLQCTVLYDKNGKVYDRYGLGGYPTMFIVNKSGKISWSNKDSGIGEYSYEDLAAKLDDKVA